MSDSKTEVKVTTDATETTEFRGRVPQKSVESREQGEGRGARVRRSIGGHQIRNFDPFLLLDEFNVQAPGGFPDHPHRGFETVTYMFPDTEGVFLHEDFAGHAGTIAGGDVQWMTAGKGILHAEMPGNDKFSHGLQLWVNLAAKDKMCEPAYQELPAKDIPKVEKDGIHAAIIAGEALGTKSKIYTRTPVHYIHYTLQPNKVLKHKLDPSWNALVYTISGEGFIGPLAEQKRDADKFQAHYSVAMARSSTVKEHDKGETSDGLVIASGDKAFSFVIVAGKPTHEPVVQHGPFVMNTMQEIQQAFHDFQLNRNGFEKASQWRSKIGNRFGTMDDDY